MSAFAATQIKNTIILLQVQNVPNEDGVEAYRKVFRMYNPITPAKLLKKFVEIVKPQKIEKLSEATLMMEQWKLKVNEAKKDFPKDFQLTESMEIAVATSMMPYDIQELIFQHAENIKTFKTFEEKIMTLISNKNDVEPVPMDIGRIQADYDRYWLEQGYTQEQSEMEVKELGWVAPGSGACFKCGRTGHVAADCWMGKGGGKQGNGKGGGKGTWDNGGKGGGKC